jgi:peptidoglycan-associated lipoprotein
MLKIASLITATVFLYSCTSNVEELHQKISPKPSVVNAQDDTQNDTQNNSEESVVVSNSSSFQSQDYDGNYTRSNSKKAIAQLEKSELKDLGVKLVLYFSFGESGIDEATTEEIIKHANFMRDNPSLNLRLEGHADERGTREFNLALGENRALAVKDILSLYDFESRIEVVSYGEESPIFQEHNEIAWEKNRRVEFIYQ